MKRKNTAFVRNMANALSENKSRLIYPGSREFPGVPQSDPLPSSKELVETYPRQSDEYFQKSYELQKIITPAFNDTMFDFTIIWIPFSAGWPAFNPTPGNQQVLWTKRFPIGRHFIVTGYSCFCAVIEDPAISHYTMAEPLEFFTRFDFLLLVDGKIPLDAGYFYQTFGMPAATGMIEREGFCILTRDPEEMSRQNYGGVFIPVYGGSNLEIIFRNYSYFFGLGVPYHRRIERVGVKLKGFYLTDDPTKQKR